MASNVNSNVNHVANFAARFCSELDNDKNFICSPLSVETVMALVALGSSNESRAEIFKALDIPNEDNLRSVFTSLTQNLKKPFISYPYPILIIANKIYVKQGNDLKPAIKKDAEKVFNAGLEQIDFRKKSDAANSINNWVANQTNNIIKDIISADSLGDDTGLVLINAIYFYILQMFYVGGKASMILVLPDETEGENAGVDGLMKRLAAGYDLMADIKSLQKTKLKVVIPKFKVETKINLKELLPKMGIETIFDREKADTNMLTSNDPLYVSEAVQKAYITVDENGTEAAAATQMTRFACCGRWWIGETFTADRPFIYLLTAHAIPIFYGKFQGN